MTGRGQRAKGSGDMKKTVVAAFVRYAALVAACAAAEGCRRTDVRDFEVSIPALTAENEAVVRQALARFGGIESDLVEHV